MKLVLMLCIAALCVVDARAAQANTTASLAAVEALLQGRFDNRAQVASTSNGEATPHVAVTIEPTAQKEWTLWHVHIDLGSDPDASFDQTWAMQARGEYDGSVSLVPYYELHQDTVPTAATFDAQRWLSLEACALRGKADKARFEGISEGEPCVAVSMNVGARRALLPVGVVREGDRLHLEMNLRGVRTPIDAERM